MSKSTLDVPPPRFFENYVLVQDQTQGLTPVPNEQFTQLITGLSVNATASADIGFDFVCDAPNGLTVPTYDRIVVSDNGWLALIGKTVSLANPSAIQTAVATVLSGSTSHDNSEQIAGAPFNGDVALLCPWFDSLYELYNTPLEYAGIWGANNYYPLSRGLSAWPASLRSDAGIFIKKNDYDPKLGRRTIVRWVRSTPADKSFKAYVIRFEVVLYECGRYEFRYDRLGPLIDTDIDLGAGQGTCGAFMPANKPAGPSGSLRYREFLEEPDVARSAYQYGGLVYDPGYSDIDGMPYRVTLKAGANNWPGPSCFSMLPPARQRRVLPRLALRDLDGALNGVTGGESSPFDDRHTVLFKSALINFPTTLPRFYGNGTSGIAERQDLFAGDFSITSSIVKSAVDQFVGHQSSGHLEPFSENRMFEQDVEGSGSADLPGLLRSKAQIRMVLPLTRETVMLGTTSSILFYDQDAKGFSVTAPSDLCDPRRDGSRISEDFKLFDPIGDLIFSGSTQLKSGGTNQSIRDSGQPFDRNKVMTEMIGDPANIAVSQFDTTTYRASDSMLLRLNITEPFVIEKIGFELPLRAGAGWFNDRTQAYTPNGLSASSAGASWGGPALTLSLFNQFYTPGFYGTVPASGSIFRELIASGTIVPSTDVTSSYEVRIIPDMGDGKKRADASVYGFLAHSSTPAAIVKPNAANQFTGSVSGMMDAAVSNGCVILLTGTTDTQSKVDDLLSRAELSLAASPTSWLNANLAYVSPIGRNKIGIFNSTGRSVFGGDYHLALPPRFPNPFYVTGSEASAWRTLFDSSDILSVKSFVRINNTTSAPYLVLPGDTLFVSLAKTRPVLKDASGSVNFSTSHDVVIPSASMYLTLYGSYLREGQQVDRVRQQPSNASYSVTIGDEPHDEYEVEGVFNYAGTTLDNYITGTMVEKRIANGVTTLVTGTRGRAFSRVWVRGGAPAGLQATLGTDYSSVMSRSVGEVADMQHVNMAVSDQERYYDTLLPRIDEIVHTNGGKVCLDGTTWNPSAPYSTVSKALFFMNVATEQSGPIAALSDNKWARAYPFETKYASLIRYTTALDTFKCTQYVTFDGLGRLTNSTPLSGTTYVSYAYVKEPDFTNQRATAGSPVDPEHYLFNWIDAVSGAQPHIIGGGEENLALPLKDDLTKIFFGIGDVKSIILTGSSLMGSQQAPSWRIFNADSLGGSKVWVMGGGPVIRGWRYGILNGFSQKSKAYWRLKRYGQLRDMLEQRQDAKFYYEGGVGLKTTVGSAPIFSRFVDSSGSITFPAYTQSSNLDPESTSSLPYFDGEVRNR